MISFLFYIHNSEKVLQEKLNIFFEVFNLHTSESIFVDDFSNDNSFDILYSFIKKNFIETKIPDRAKLLRQDECRGRGRAIQWGLGNINKEFVALININNLDIQDIGKMKIIIESFVVSNNDAHFERKFSIFRSSVIKNFWIKSNSECVEAEIYALLKKKKYKVFLNRCFSFFEYFVIIKTKLRSFKKSFKST